MFSDILTCLETRVYYSGFSRETEPIGYVYRYREKEIYFKELAHAIMEADKFKSAGWAGRLETPESQRCK